MQNVTYCDLSARYGNNLAYDLLITIEKLAKINDNIIYIDEEARLQRALAAISEVSIGA